MRRRALLMGGKFIPNTIIGGIGGTINTKALLATKLGISESIIRGFRIVGSDVHCRITSDYSMPTHCFQNDDDIDSYLDLEGKLVSFSGIRHFYNSSIKEAILPSITETPTDLFNLSDLESIQIQNLIYMGGNSFYGTKITELNTPNLTIIGVGGLRLTTNIESIFSSLTTIQQFGLRNSSALPDLSYVTTLGPEAMYGTDYVYLSMPSLIHCTAFAPFNMMNLVQTADFDSLESITPSTSFFAGWSSCNRITMKKLKTYGAYAAGGFPTPSHTGFNTLKTGCLIQVHEDLATANSGNPHEALVWVKANRGATVEFYDDDGNYVSTL